MVKADTANEMAHELIQMSGNSTSRRHNHHARRRLFKYFPNYCPSRHNDQKFKDGLNGYVVNVVNALCEVAERTRNIC